MNFLSRFLPRENQSKKPVATLSPGEFSLVRSEDSPKGRRELISKEAELALVGTTREFYYQIQVTDLNQEDDRDVEPEELLASEDGRTFLVHPELQLGYYLVNGRVAIAWKDIDGGDGDRFEFLCASTVSRESLDVFDRKACEAQYGQKYGHLPPSDAPESVFEEFTHDYNESKPSTVSDKSSSTRPDEASTEIEGEPFSAGRTMTQEIADLCVYDSTQGVFISPKNLRGLNAVLLDQGNYEYFLEVRGEKHAHLGSPIRDDLNQYVDLVNCALIFNYTDESGLVMSYLLRFKTPEALNKFENTLAIAQYESRTRQRWQDVPESQQSYLMDAINRMGVNEPTEDEYDEEAEASEETEADMEVDEDKAQDPDAAANEINSALEVGHLNDRTFVVRGNRIGVFKNTDRQLKYNTTIQGLDFDPKKIMLHEQDRSLVLQGDNDRQTLYRMDLETGKIADEWNTGKNVNDFNPVSKFAQTTPEGTLMGVANQSMFRIDPRVQNGGNIVADQEKSYKSTMNMSNIASTADGYLVVGNKKGEIRLYDKLGKVAKTMIPGLGDPFLGVDVTADGRFVLATCEKYLLLIEVVTKDTNGFIQSWSKDKKPIPRKLQISPENMVYMYQQSQQPIKFTPARFNTGPEIKEGTIVTATGPYLVTWNLHKVLRGEPNAYLIKRYGSQITAENFKFGTDKRVILTLEDDVNMVAKSALRSPNQVFKSR